MAHFKRQYIMIYYPYNMVDIKHILSPEIWTVDKFNKFNIFWTTYGRNLCWMDSVLKLLHCDFPVFGMPISLLLIWPTFVPYIFVWTYMFILSDSLSDLKSFEFKKRSFSPIPILRMRLFINERQVKTNAVETISWEGVDPNS